MKDRNIKLFFTHQLLFQFSFSMLHIVLPIFIYQLFDSISAVFLFNFSWNLIHTLLFIPIFNIAMKLKNPKYFMAIGMIFYVAALYLFGESASNPNLIYPATLMFSLFMAFYWMIRHWFFAVNSDYQKMGKQVSALAIMSMVVAFLAPIVAGWVSFFVSFNATFILGAFAAFLSIIPILMFYAPPHPRLFSWEKAKRILKKPALKAIRPAYFWEGVNFNFGMTTWILAFAIFIGTILDLGILVGATTLIAAFLTWLMGHWFDKRKRKRLLNRVMALRASTIFLYTSIYFFPNLAYVYLIESLNSFTLHMRLTITDSYLYAFGNKIHPIHFNFNREVLLGVSRFISSGILAIAFLWLPAGFLFVFLGISAFSTLGWLTLKRSDHLLH